MSVGDKSEVLFLMGRLSMVVGDDTSAAKHLEACLELLPETEDTNERAAVLEELGKLKTRVEKWAESFAAHENALRLYEKAGNKPGQVREWINIGGTHKKRGDLVRAREAYSKALSLASMEEDRGAQSAVLNNIALLDWEEGKLREAETRFKESIRLAHALKNHAGEARGLENLAELLRVQGRITEMINLLLESSEAFRRAGEIEDFKRLQATSAESLGAQGRLSEGIELCREALADPDLRKRMGLLQRATRYDLGDASLELSLIGLLRSSGDLKDAEKEVGKLFEIAESMDDTILKAKADVELALVRESSGDLDSALSKLEDAQKILLTSGEKQGLIAVKMLMGMVQEKKGDYRSAGEHYQEALRQAELIGDSSAFMSARRNLESIGVQPD
jgi:tetratricopeptide (TPR) repeat protein